MEAEITSVKQNPLLDRFEAEVELSHSGEATPAEDDIVARIAAENDLDEDAIKVEGIYTGFGSNVSRAELKITGEFEFEDELEETVEEEKPAGGEEPDTAEETGESPAADYDDIVSGTISDAKEKLQELDEPDWEAALEAEKDNKDRKTFKKWLQNRE